MGWLSSLFRGRELSDVLNKQKIVKVHGIRFTIKKCDPLSFLDGSKVMMNEFDTYKVKDVAAVPAITESILKKMKEHYTDVILSGVVSPVLVRKKEHAINGAIFVENLFTDWELAQELYVQIVEFTYGKKKFKQNLSHALTSSS